MYQAYLDGIVEIRQVFSYPCTHSAAETFCLEMSTLKKLKHISNRYKFTVLGYIRKKQQELSLSNIPTMMCYLCLQFYFHGENFAKCTGNIELSQDKTLATALEDEASFFQQNVYAKSWISAVSNCVASWTFKINANDTVRVFISSTDGLEQADSYKYPFYYM